MAAYDTKILILGGLSHRYFMPSDLIKIETEQETVEAITKTEDKQYYKKQTIILGNDIKAKLHSLFRFKTLKPD